MRNSLLSWEGTGREIRAPVLSALLVCRKSFSVKAEMCFLVLVLVSCLDQALNPLLCTKDASRPFPVICDFASLPQVLTRRSQSPRFSLKIILKTPVVRCPESSGLAIRWWTHRTFRRVHCGYSVERSECQPTSPGKGGGLDPSPRWTTKPMHALVFSGHCSSLAQLCPQDGQAGFYPLRPPPRVKVSCYWALSRSSDSNTIEMSIASPRLRQEKLLIRQLCFLIK